MRIVRPSHVEMPNKRLRRKRASIGFSADLRTMYVSNTEATWKVVMANDVAAGTADTAPACRMA
jgi:hypothetical protein